jgi:hypothetical protein
MTSATGLPALHHAAHHGHCIQRVRLQGLLAPRQFGGDQRGIGDRLDPSRLSAWASLSLLNGSTASDQAILPRA